MEVEWMPAQCPQRTQVGLMAPPDGGRPTPACRPSVAAPPCLHTHAPGACHGQRVPPRCRPDGLRRRHWARNWEMPAREHAAMHHNSNGDGGHGCAGRGVWLVRLPARRHAACLLTLVPLQEKWKNGKRREKPMRRSEMSEGSALGCGVAAVRQGRRHGA